MVAPAIQTIPLDLNAGDKGQGAVAYALAHETTHFIKDFSPAKYEAYTKQVSSRRFTISV